MINIVQNKIAIRFLFKSTNLFFCRNFLLENRVNEFNFSRETIEFR